MLFKPKLKNSEADILHVLSGITDPDLHRDIVSLGFVKELKIGQDAVSFNLELTTPACPVRDQLRDQCIEKIKQLGFETVNVKMTSHVGSSVPKSSGEAGRIVLPNVKNLVAIASGKGGVGKSTVCINLAVALSQTGAKVGVLDADIYGPSIPTMFGLNNRPQAGEDDKILPLTKNGVRLISMGFLVPEDKPIVWRGPMVHGALTQFLTKVAWGELDYLLIDMPPGTGDAQLTMSQIAPLSGAIIVTTPQDVSLLDARRGLLMFQSVQVPVLGIIENMSAFHCPKCGEISHIFSHGGGERFAAKMKIPLLGSVPLDPRVTQSGDSGSPMVSAFPESEVAKIYRKVAGEVAAHLSILCAKAAGAFKPLSLEWK